MSIHSELRYLRSDVIHFKNKPKFVILKITSMPHIKETFVGSNVNTKSALRYPFEFCSDVPFIGTICSRNWHLLFVFSLLIPHLTFVFLLNSLLVPDQPDISKMLFVSCVKTSDHTTMCYYLLNIFGEPIE